MKKISLKWFVSLSTIVCSWTIMANSHALEGAMPESIETIINELVAEKGLSRKNLQTIFKNAQIKPDVVKAIKRPAERLPWQRYRQLFVTQKSIRNGVEFWRKHRDTLKRAEDEFGVPAAVIVAIIGIETRYGKYTGRFRILDSLTTLTLKYPRRQKFFRNELKAFLLLAHEEQLDPLVIKGSYAGAMGIPQFIASSYRGYAIDFNQDNVRDLINQTADAIGSVANYLHSHHWRRGEKIIFDVQGLTQAKAKRWLGRQLKPNTTVGQLRADGVTNIGSFAASTPVGLISLNDGNEDRFCMTLRNFYVITRYNHSINYAMSVYELSQSITQEMNRS